MAIIALLETLLRDEPMTGYQSWRDLARNRGIEFRAHRFDGPRDPSAYQSAHRLLDEADGLFVRLDAFLHDEGLVEHIKERVTQGVPLLVRIDVNQLGAINAFLGHYGIEGTSIGMCLASQIWLGPRLLRMSRDEYPGAFRDLQLFAGVTHLVISGPNVIKYRGEAVPILTIPEEKADTVELTSDLPVDCNTRELSCMVAHYDRDSGGTVLAISGAALLDDYVGPAGVEWPGVSANRQFANNLLDFLTKPAARRN
jgi:hypothetical protein